MKVGCHLLWHQYVLICFHECADPITIMQVIFWLFFEIAWPHGTPLNCHLLHDMCVQSFLSTTNWPSCPTTSYLSPPDQVVLQNQHGCLNFSSIFIILKQCDVATFCIASKQQMQINSVVIVK